MRQTRARDWARALEWTTVAHAGHITLVQVGPEWRRDQWWRDPGGMVSSGDIARRYDADATLSAEAEATGWHRDGRQRWLVPDRSSACLVSTADPTDVERLPGSRGLARTA